MRLILSESMNLYPRRHTVNPYNWRASQLHSIHIILSNHFPSFETETQLCTHSILHSIYSVNTCTNLPYDEKFEVSLLFWFLMFWWIGLIWFDLVRYCVRTTCTLTIPNQESRIHSLRIWDWSGIRDRTVQVPYGTI